MKQAMFSLFVDRIQNHLTYPLISLGEHSVDGYSRVSGVVY